MTLDEWNTRMRALEAPQDNEVPPGLFLVIRLDGRGFTRKTKETWALEAPFDLRFRDLMLEAAEHFFHCGFSPLLAYTQSDEISVLLGPENRFFNRRPSKLISLAAGEASARFSLSMGDVACFDARISPLPDAAHVASYFLWRQADAHRNTLNAHCYWALRHSGVSPQAADKHLHGLSSDEKNALLNEHGVDFASIPDWQRKGAAVYWETYQKPAVDLKTGQAVIASRRQLKRDCTLPEPSAFAAWVEGIIASA